MKKHTIRFLSLLCALLMITSCGANNEEIVETVSLYQLIDDLDNGARATLNIGKTTTVCGQIVSIETDHCYVDLFISANSNFKISLPLETLAQLNEKQFIAVKAKVNNVETETKQNHTFYTYTFEGVNLVDFNECDLHIKEYFTNKQYDDYGNNYDLLSTYFDLRNENFLIKDESYLLGEWEYDTGSSNHKGNVTFEMNNSYSWTYEHNKIFVTEREIESKIVTESENGSWYIEQGTLIGFMENFYTSRHNKIYVISENIFLFKGVCFYKKSLTSI